MISVLFILPNLSAGGAERVTINFIRQMDPAKHEVSLAVFELTDDLRDQVPEHVHVIDLGTKKASRSLFSLFRLIFRLKPDYVYCTHSRVAVLLAAVRLFYPNFRLVSRVPSMPSLEREQGYTSKWVARLYAWAYRKADVVLAQTTEMKTDVIAEYLLKAEYVVIANNPLDTQTIDRLASNSKSPFSNSTFNVVASGRHSREKGFDLLIPAFAQLVNSGVDACLYVVGREAEDSKLLKSLVEKEGLEDRVDFVGFTDNPYVYYRHCDLFVLSSRWEGFPNALLENYYLGTPVVTTDCVPIVSELVVNGRNGFVVKKEDQNALGEVLVEAAGDLKRGSFVNPTYQGFQIQSLLSNV